MTAITNKRGNVYLISLGVMALMLMLFFLVMDIQHIYAMRDVAEIELERVANTAIELAVRDDYRTEHETQLRQEDVDAAFEACLQTFSHDDDWQVANISIQLSHNPPQITITGEIELRMNLLGQLLPVSMNVPVRVTSKQVRID